ncbi:sugar transferase [Weissella coleopterorum]|uniref:Glucosyltransferase 3 n=1 Tax=Weissella coleopterorum TaxID=2714949 RepID=A0A6G8AZC0_9LACO|nr:sugar transferase [Weissella coleopterorum]QIL50441.1 sugar transferase [Weissella coleopterorum]
MKKFITNLYGQSEQSTAMLAQHMVAQIAKNEGYSEISVPAFPVTSDSESELLKRIDGMLPAVTSKDLVLAQLPSWNGIAFDEVFLRKIRSRTQKLVVFIHDFVPLMFDNNSYLFERYLDAYNLADLVIVPSEKMGAMLVEHGLNVPYKVQTIWDHLTCVEGLSKPEFKREIQFAGNMGRFPFIKEWNYQNDLLVYSNRFDNFAESETLHIKGWKHDDQLLRELNQGGFGLVWSENIENQSEREYSEMNVSFKFSSYLAAGIPLIVNRGLAKQSFVESQGIGLVADSLEEVNEYVSNINADEYQRLLQNVAGISTLIQDGFFTKKLLIEIEEFLFMNV